jgi:hypothetical protein
VTVIAFPNDGLLDGDLKAVIAEGCRHGWTVKQMISAGGTVGAILLNQEGAPLARKPRAWVVTRLQGRYAIHSEGGELLADGIVLSEVLQLAIHPTRSMEDKVQPSRC